MKRVLSTQDSQGFERFVTEEKELPSLVLMENAARGVLDVLRREYAIGTSSNIYIICGKGKNGGDGLALARLLFERGICPTVLTLHPAAKMAAETKQQFTLLKDLLPATSLRKFEKELTLGKWQAPHIIVDAILGTGATGKLHSTEQSAVDWINQTKHEYGSKVISIDIPSGIDSDKGIEYKPQNINNEREVQLLAVKADRTVAILAPKLGLYAQDAPSFTGEIDVVPFGYPIQQNFRWTNETFLVEVPDILRMVPRRERTSSKFDFGRVFALCGSRGMTGAAIMSAGAALHAGAGLVNVAVPLGERSLVAQAMPELMTVGCRETKEGAPAPEAWDDIKEYLERADAILIGSGLRPGTSTDELLLRIIREVDKPMVIDAGALGALAGHLDILKKRKSPTILTPHSGELARMLELPWQEVTRERMRHAREFARNYGVTVVVKGAPTYIAMGDNLYINTTGNSGMATAGSGDVLGGILTGMLAQKTKAALDAALAGVYVHGLAGDFAAAALTAAVMTATDITTYLGQAYRTIGAE